ncbi:MAG: hypothetical protein O7G83_15325 [Proteobacteria bacterium]|nr:hypothetical protein [Pseudomonadota bacterium]
MSFILSTPSLATKVEQDAQDADPEDDRKRIACSVAPGVNHAMARQRARNQHTRLQIVSGEYDRDAPAVASESRISVCAGGNDRGCA